MPRDTLRGRNKYTSIKLSGDGSLGSNLDTIYVDETASILKLSKNKLKISGDIEIVNSDSLTVKDGYLISKKSISFQNTEVVTRASATVVDFGRSNKVAIDLDGNITTLMIYPPPGSANLILNLRQDGTGSRTVAIWGAVDGSQIKWQGGSAPTLTTTANKHDIIAFFYDESNKTFYGQASLNF
tara:strand:+ start:1449 stop:2000 length:552 start_codon:yes stop_codon:yes gene_type:complete